jgi:hypothetical protein
MAAGGGRAHLLEILEDPVEYVDSWDLVYAEGITAILSFPRVY